MEMSETITTIDVEGEEKAPIGRVEASRRVRRPSAGFVRGSRVRRLGKGSTLQCTISEISLVSKPIGAQKQASTEFRSERPSAALHYLRLQQVETSEMLLKRYKNPRPAAVISVSLD